MGVAGAYADEMPGCQMSDGSAGMTGSAGAGGRGGASGGISGSGGRGGSSAAAGGAGATASAATFSDVYNLMLCSGCGLCHGGSANLALNSTKSEVYEALVGSDPQGTPAATAAETGMCTGQRRVMPGMPDQSLLYVKVAGTQTCGTVMPPGDAPTFTAAQLDMMRSWIAAGAKKN
jgi:hypothetical protein